MNIGCAELCPLPLGKEESFFGGAESVKVSSSIVDAFEAESS
jgi:hypothetical protein